MTRAQIAMLLTAVVATVGLVDALNGGDLDLAVVFAGIVVLLLVAVGQLRLGRRCIPLRADLAGWLQEQALATGESPAVLADRCVAAYRAGLTDDGPA